MDKRLAAGDTYSVKDSAALLVAREKLTAAVSPYLLRETMKRIRATSPNPKNSSARETRSTTPGN